MTIAEAGALLRRKEVTCVELVQDALGKVEAIRHLNAFITITAEQALSSAAKLDQELRNGNDRGPLHGIPIALKDLYFTKGTRTTNGSKLFADFVPGYNATVVGKLQAAGAVSVGKLNMHELAYGITSSNPHYGSVCNPCNPKCIPGGSSGGSAAAVAGGAVLAAMGSDTGASIRNPASFCGIVGIKPTFGRVSRYGCFPLGLTLDTMGPLTHTVADSATVLTAIAGRDDQDESTTHRSEVFSVSDAPRDLKGVRVGRPENFFTTRLDPDVSKVFEQDLRKAQDLGAEIVPIETPDPEALNTVARTVLLCEATACLQPCLSRRSDIGPDVMALLDQGSIIPAADYINAQRVRRQLQKGWRKMFDRIDVLFTPVSPIPAPEIGQTKVMIGGQEEDTRLAATKFLRGINALGFPALAIPSGKSGEGLPIGLHLVGPSWSEQRLFNYGFAMG